MIRAPTVPAMSERRRRLHKLRNLAQSALIIAGMLGILGLCAGLVWGWAGVVWAVLLASVSLLVTPTVAPEWVMRLHGAVPLSPRDFPEGYELLHRLAARAGLARVPRLHWLPTSLQNAFAVGRPDRAAIGISDGLLRTLTLRELAAVLAHELSHVRNDDLWIMGLADIVARLTSALSWIGQLLLVFNLPFLAAGEVMVPWLVVALLVFAPTLVGLLQLALARAREFDADLDAAGLTGDPRGLASALTKLERRRGRAWEEILLPGRRMPDPSLLRTHPPTEERIRRLLDLCRWEEPAAAPARPVALPQGLTAAPGPPRWRVTGTWY